MSPFSLFPKEEDFFLLFKRQAVLVREGCDQLHEMMQSFDRIEDRGMPAERRCPIEHAVEIDEMLVQRFRECRVERQQLRTIGRKFIGRERRQTGDESVALELLAGVHATVRLRAAGSSKCRISTR